MFHVKHCVDYNLEKCYNIQSISTQCQIDKIHKEMIISIINELKEMFDYVLLDTSAGIESGFKYTCSVCDRILVVSTLDLTSLQDADRIIGLLMKENIQNIQVVINRYNPKYLNSGISIQLSNALDYLCVECIGVIYDDEQIIRGNNLGYPIMFNETSKAYQGFKQVCNALLGNEVIIPKEHRSLLKRLFTS